MDVRLLWFMLTLVANWRVSALPLGCSYNGTTYTEGDAIRTEEPCLSCVCRGGSLVCNLKVCADPPDTLSPGCFIVHTANDCCPQLVCGETQSPDGVELRTGITEEYKVVENGCFINGSIYAEGSAVSGSDLCEYCYCIHSEVKCIKPRCFQPFEGCKALYRESSCCPTHYDCRDANVSIPAIQSEYECESEGVQYENGDKIESSNSSSCESCYCVKGIIRCAPIVCSMEPLEGCQPVNSPGQCCPMSFLCAKESENTTTTNIKTTPIVEVVTEIIELHDNTTKSNEILEQTTLMEYNTTETVNQDGQAEEEDTTESVAALGVEEMTPTVPWDGEERFASGENFSGFQATTIQNGLNETTDVPEDPTTTNLIVTSPSSFPETPFGKQILEVEIESKMDFNEQKEGLEALDEIPINSSQGSDDYDSYDYNEPKLPPSLPNLVIFPFVAADAVVRDEKTRKSETYDKNSIKRIDTQATFYDFFSPPVQTEGGFVPKKPIFSFEPYYKNSYLEKEKLPQTSIAGGTFGIVPQMTGKNGSNTPEFLQTHMMGVEPQHKVASNILSVTPDPFSEVIKTEQAPDLSFVSEPTRFAANYSTIKPVTVTYKNIVVDYYPDYLVTSSRTYIKENEEKIEKPLYRTTNAESVPTTPPNPSYVLPTTAVTKPDIMVVQVENATAPVVLETTVPNTLSEISFFDEFLKSFLSEDVASTTKPGTKYKYSSKIRSPGPSTVKSNFPNFNESTKASKNSSSYYLFELLFNPEAVVSLANSTEKQMTSPPAETHVAPVIPPLLAEDTKTEDVEVIEKSWDEEEIQDQTKKPIEASTEVKKVLPNLGGLLKLAGCNIYGRMYRVGKIIVELSGPCLECVCTDLGVQCKSLTC